MRVAQATVQALPSKWWQHVRGISQQEDAALREVGGKGGMEGVDGAARDVRIGWTANLADQCMDALLL